MKRKSAPVSRSRRRTQLARRTQALSHDRDPVTWGCLRHPETALRQQVEALSAEHDGICRTHRVGFVHHTPGSVLRQSCAQVIVLVTLYFLKAEQVH